MGDFGSLFSKSWKEYKSSFGLFFKVFLLFALIPGVIYLVLLTFFDFVNISEAAIQFVWPSLLVGILILLIFSFIANVTYVYISIFRGNSKMSFGKAVGGALGYFWRYVGLSLLLFIMLVPLFALLIIPGLIFLIYWTFSPFVLMRENTSIWQSIKRSKLVVKGRWWTTFGYIFLLGIILTLISFAFSIPENVFTFVNALSLIQGKTLTFLFILQIVSSFAGLITVPLRTLFVKNFYLDLRTNPQKHK